MCVFFSSTFSVVLGNKNVHVRGLNGLLRPEICGGAAVSTGNRAIFSERRSVDDREKSSSELCPGSHVALVTPFHEKGGEIDEISLRKLLRWHLDSGTNGILALGTTGEANMLTNDEKVHACCSMLLLMDDSGVVVVACWYNLVFVTLSIIFKL